MTARTTQAQKQSKSAFRLAFSRIVKFRRNLVAALVWSMIFAIVPMQVPILTGALVNGILGNSASIYGLLTLHNQGQIIDFAIIGLLATALLYGVTAYYSTTSTARLSRRFLSDLRKDLIGKLDFISVDVHSRFGSGELLNRVIVDTQSTKRFVENIFVKMTTNVLEVLYPVTLLFLINPFIALIASSMLPLQWLITREFQTKLRKATKRVRTDQGRLTAIAKENLDAIETIQSSSAEVRSIAQFSIQSDKLLSDQLEAQRYVGLINALIWGLTSLGLMMTWWFGSLEVVSGQISMGTLVTLTGFVVLLYAPFRKFTEMANIYQKGLVAFERIQDVIDIRSSIQEIPNAPELVIGHGEMQFQNVSFSYEGQMEQALTAVNLTIKPNQLTALVGRNGSGKSTMLKLMLRLYDPTHGKILVDGQDIREVTLRSLRSKIAVVPQAPLIFNDTVSENVRLGNPDVSDKEIEEACLLANATEFITKLEKGFDTVLGQGYGVILSGGQAQRLAIARALLRKPKILLLDEPSSALDPESEIAISNTLVRLKSHVTTVVVSHRARTAEIADSVVLMDYGRIAEEIERTEYSGETEIRRPSSRLLGHFIST
ncbi:MAG: ABC transporter ATP-binding protein [Nitrososphaerota archaeon]|nr:ABC transporter ATP-binding protein [Nitrososphaerota archaeon]